jgi:hypothetical protein
MKLAIKLVATALLVLVAGVPVLDTWVALFLAACVMALVFGTPQTRWGRLAVAAGIALTIVGVKAVLPRADIAEGHNLFLVAGDGEPLERVLPGEMFHSWRARFDSLYPPGDGTTVDRSHWRPNGFVPKTLFTQSADAIWRRAKYTRQVDAIDFRTLGEFRAGFANELVYNWWSGPLRRESVPFYAMYELTPATAGSRLWWKGQLFWETGDGRFEEIVHDEVASRDITPADAGKRIYAAFFPTPGSVLSHDKEFYFRFDPSTKLRIAAWFEDLLTIVGGIVIVVLTVRIRWPSYVRALAIFSVSYALMAAYIWVSFGKYLGQTYPPHGGGDDGMVHDGWGRMMAMLAGNGNIVEALKGAEPVYWFTPGTRYVRMIEKLVFGDTNHLFALILACIPLLIFYLIRHFAGTRWAWLATALVCAVPVGNLSFLQYIANAKLGYGESLASGLFLLGLLLMVRTQPEWGGQGRNVPLAGVAGAALAASMFIRPNVAFAVVWLGAAYAWASWRRRDIGTIAAVGTGLALALWMPFHNWYYGGQFHLISASGSTIIFTLGLRDYLSAIGDVVRGQLDTPATAVISQQLGGWLWNPGFLIRDGLKPLAWALHGVKLLALTVTCWVAYRWVAGAFATRTPLPVVAVASICAHLPMMFIFNTHFRYAMLAWDLSVIVLIAWLAGFQQGALRYASEDIPAFAHR